MAVVEKRKQVFLMRHGIVANILAPLARPRRDRLVPPVVVCLDLHGLHSIGLLHLVVLVCDCPAVVRNMEGCDSSREGAVQRVIGQKARGAQYIHGMNMARAWLNKSTTEGMGGMQGKARHLLRKFPHFLMNVSTNVLVSTVSLSYSTALSSLYFLLAGFQAIAKVHAMLRWSPLSVLPEKVSQPASSAGHTAFSRALTSSGTTALNNGGFLLGFITAMMSGCWSCGSSRSHGCGWLRSYWPPSRFSVS